MDFLDELDTHVDTHVSASGVELLSPEEALEPTLSVREINDAISEAISQSFSKEVWVKGEIQRLNFHSSGHIYFNLVDPSSSRSGSCSIPVSLFKNTSTKIKGNIREILAEDREVRLFVKPDFYAPYGKMSLIVRDVDTAFTLGQIAIARRALLEKLNKEGILRSNGERELDELPTNIALVTALDSAAYHDVTDQLASSGIGFQIRVINALMQGNESAASVAKALKSADEFGCDVVLLCRGGGSKSDLSSFDTEAVARTICAMKTPVLTGLGHQIDISVADMVAHSSVKTPTACAQFLIEHVGASVKVVEDLVAEIAQRSVSQLESAETRLAYIQQRLSDSNYVLERSSALLETYKNALRNQSSTRLILAQRQLEAASKLVSAHDPQRVLERGYSLVTNAQGKLVSSVNAVKQGGTVRIRVSDGEIESEVLNVKEK